MNQANKKMSNELADLLNELNRDEEIDVLVYVKRPSTSLEEYLQVKKEKGELQFNFLEYANCYVVEAPKPILLEIAEREDVSRMDVNPRFTVQY